MSFQKAQAFVKLKEGGYTADSRDSGNWTGGKVNSGSLIGTNHGISAPVLNAYYKSKYGRSATKADMRSLSYDTALSIYKAEFWDKYNLDTVADFNVQLVIYDGIVNQGSGNMRKIVSESLDMTGKKVPSSDVFKPVGIKAINDTPPKALFDAIKATREKYYRNLSSFSVYGKGWLNRLGSIVYEAKESINDAVASGNVTVGKSVLNIWPVFILGLALSAVGAFAVFKS